MKAIHCRLILAASLLTAFGLAGCNASPQGREIKHLARGQKYLEKKDYRSAVIEFKVAAQNMPKDAEPVYQLGVTYLAVGAPSQAFEQFHKALELNPNHRGANYQMALLQAADSRPETLREASSTLLKWLGDNSAGKDATEAMGALALAQAKLGNRAEALRWLEKSAMADSGNMRAASAVIGVYAARGEADAAREVGRELAEKQPSSPAAITLRAEVSLATRDLADADEQIAKALQLQRDYRPALQLRLRREIMKNDPGSAEQVSQALANLPDKQMWAAYGRLLFSENKVPEAMAEFERALKEHGNPMDMRDEYAFLLAGAGRKKEAEAVLSGTLGKDPKDTAALLWRTTLEVDRGAFDAAAKDIQTLEDMKAFSGKLSYQKARILLAGNQTAKAGNLLAEALESNPRLLQARLDLARLLTANGNAKTALEVLNKANPLEKTTTEFASVRNIALMAAGQVEDARKGVAALASGKSAAFYYQDALLRVGARDLVGAQKSIESSFAIQPGAPETLKLLGDVMRMQGQTAKFDAMVREAAAKNPKSPSLQLTLGRQLLAAGNDSGASAAFEAAKTAGAVAEAEAALAGLETRQGKLDRARQRLLGLAKTHDSAGLRLQLAGIDERKGSAPAVVTEQYLKALQLEPGNVVAMNNLADCLARQNKLDDAKFWGEKAIAATPGNPVAEDTLGWIYYRQGKYNGALPLLQKSAHDGDRAVAHYHLGAVLARLGDTNGARKEYELGVKEDPNSPDRASVGELFDGKVQLARK